MTYIKGSELNFLSAACLEYEEDLKGLTLDQRRRACKGNETVTITIKEGQITDLSDADKFLFCNAYYSYIFLAMKKLTDKFERLYKFPLFRWLFDRDLGLLQEIYRILSILDQMVNDPQSVSSDERRQVFEFTHRIPTLSRQATIINIAIWIALINLVMIGISCVIISL